MESSSGGGSAAVAAEKAPALRAKRPAAARKQAAVPSSDEEEEEDDILDLDDRCIWLIHLSATPRSQGHTATELLAGCSRDAGDLVTRRAIAIFSQVLPRSRHRLQETCSASAMQLPLATAPC